ncbi:MAG: T9SS type A sorting domain-containing protein [Bacteroidetes bacterium]|nr:T9SS type A sorting domain-containing protein [Bacteroidota bacterium]
MKNIKFLLIFGSVLFQTSITAQNDTLALLFKNSFTAFEMMRNNNGVYRDAKVLSGNDFFPSSVASIGMGLISLTIADGMNWINDAEEKALITLKSITGNHPSFNPDRNASGYFRHWINMGTGQQEWNSEYSTIDSGILTCGALFCKKYFCENDSIRKYADLLWNSIDWSKSIQNPETGGIYLEMLANGEGKTSSVTLPFNEYMIVAWLAMNQEIDNPGQATELWNTHYADPANLQTKVYGEIEVPTDHPGHFLSSFVFQFPYYLCHYFSTNDDYLQVFSNARRADSLWWANKQIGADYLWGLGAGSSNAGSGYHADAVNDNPSQIYSPHIISGFLPVYQNGVQDLLNMYKHGDGLYTLPNANSDVILWRKSLNDPTWKANEVQGVDYSSMLFGLASLPEFLGVEFFIDNNNFFEEPCGTPTGTTNQDNLLRINILPNPTTDHIRIEISNTILPKIQIDISDLNGTILFKKTYLTFGDYFTEEIGTRNFSSGILFVRIRADDALVAKKIIKY